MSSSSGASGTQKYLFNIQNPEATVKDVAESAMRDIVGQSNIQLLWMASEDRTGRAKLCKMCSIL
jgi:membrane protease subunit HflK